MKTSYYGTIVIQLDPKKSNNPEYNTFQVSIPAQCTWLNGWQPIKALKRLNEVQYFGQNVYIL